MREEKKSKRGIYFATNTRVYVSHRHKKDIRVEKKEKQDSRGMWIENKGKQVQRSSNRSGPAELIDEGIQEVDGQLQAQYAQQQRRLGRGALRILRALHCRRVLACGSFGTVKAYSYEYFLRWKYKYPGRGAAPCSGWESGWPQSATAARASSTPSRTPAHAIWVKNIPEHTQLLSSTNGPAVGGGPQAPRTLPVLLMNSSQAQP